MYTSKDPWLRVKHLVREVESDDDVLIIDDRIAEQPSTKESPLIFWYYDHSQGSLPLKVNRSASTKCHVCRGEPACSP